MLVAESLGRMPPYGVEHVAALGAIVVIGAAALVAVRRARAAGRDDLLDRALRASGWGLLALSVFWTLWGFLPAHWTIEQSLPFHFSDAIRFVTAIALITRAGWAVVVSYYWGLTLNLQSVVTPDLNYLDVPWLEFVMYWVFHGTALIAPVVLVWGLGLRPTWRGYVAGFAATLLWAGIAIAANAVTGANYAYLSRGPAGPSILDLLGPWPVYILWEAVLIAGVWALMTWPWNTRAARARGRVVGRFGLVRDAFAAPVAAPAEAPDASVGS